MYKEKICMRNPFIFKGYRDAEHFFDREKELALLLDCVKKHVDVTLIAQRRMGKTGLIHRLIDELQATNSGVTPIYVDIFATNDFVGFNNALTEAILRAYPENTSVGKKFLSFVRSLRPTLSFDQLTGSVQVQLLYQNEPEKAHTLKSLLDYLEQQGSPILLAIDEFQQIREYPEANLEALLRSYVQDMHNVSFIFCGSRKHLMTDIFSNPKRPFYASTQFLMLDKIPAESYQQYIADAFAKDNRHIDSEAVEFILSWTRRHTYYTQRLCNEVFDKGGKTVTIEDVKVCCDDLLVSNEPYFLQYKQLLTDNQWNYLIAVAKEEELEKPCANPFLKQYNIGASAVSKRLLNALCDKDIIMCETTKERTFYAISDLFFMRWLAREY